VAKAMMARVMQEADRRDINNVYTVVRVDNKAGLHLGRKFGFGITSTDKRDPSLYMMEKMLHNNNPVPPSA
jgi:ribosomal protein S18 acetylase RimI-like enzyme